MTSTAAAPAPPAPAAAELLPATAGAAGPAAPAAGKPGAAAAGGGVTIQAAQGEGEGQIYKILYVGAGIVGVHALANLSPEDRAASLLIDSHDDIGGLWARVPAWQTVQIDPIDFCTEGLTTRKAVWDAGDVMHLMRTKVALHGLAPHILLGHRLDAMEWSEGGGHWACTVTRVADGAPLVIRTRALFLTTGKHAAPKMPAFPADGSVEVMHSSALADFGRVKGRRVAVVGAGASGLDILMGAIEAGAEGQIEWVVRTPMHFLGVQINKMALVVPLQLLLGCALSTLLINAFLNLVMFARHAAAGTLSWLPRRLLDIRYEQPVPGRGPLLAAAARARVTRHAGAGAEVARVEGGAVVLKSGAVLPNIDVLVLATGYSLPARPAGFEAPANFAGCLSTGAHSGRLYIPEEELLDATGSTPLAAYLLHNTLMALLREPGLLREPPAAGMAAYGACGRRRLYNCMEPQIYAAPLMRRELPFLTWRLRMAGVYLYYRLLHRTTVFFSDRVLGTGLNLDDMPRAAAAAAGWGAADAAGWGAADAA
ncbi:MAG: hypothetical protein J3K34DRAFT_516674 [Monoraphidium minutum]|nr:MAG: hypothetical protein J3K34DRAFT_516674 [Monoraphidium minutum]